MIEQARSHSVASIILALVLLLFLAACRPDTPPSALPAGTPTRTRLPASTIDPHLPTATPFPTVPWGTLPQAAYWEGAFVSAVAWFPDGARVAATTSAGVLLADGRTLAEVGVVLPWQPVATVEFPRDGAWMILAVTDTVQLWSETGDGWEARRLEGGGGKVFGLAITADNTLLAAGEFGGTVRIWDPGPGTEVHVWPAHAGEVFAVAFSPDGRLLASAGRDGYVRLWQVGTWMEVASYKHTDTVRGIAFSPDGRLLASASFDRTIGLWDVPAGRPLPALRGHISQVTTVHFSPDSTLLASGGEDGTVRVWDLATDQILAWSVDHIDRLSGVAFSPDGQTIASGGWDGSVRLWDVRGLSR